MRAKWNCVIGVDFDNTIINYNEIIYSAAAEGGLISEVVDKSKTEIRDKIRCLPDGEAKWQKLQAFVYGKRIGEADLFEGVPAFFTLCRRNGAKVYIISHKTKYASYGETQIDLRASSLEWMRAKGFFSEDGLALSREAVFFGATRQEKIDRITRLGCTHFVDDLEETFLEESFPRTVEKILFAPRGARTVSPGVRVMAGWREISEYFFATNS